MSLSFKTKSLIVHTIKNKQIDDDFLSTIINILSFEVVKTLPSYFHNILSKKAAKDWLLKMNNESELFIIEKLDPKEIIGFLFIHKEKKEAHIGYLLAKEFWGKGFAKELLIGYIEFCKKEKNYKKLIGGVDKENIASSYLLEKVGFIKTKNSLENVDFYELEICE